MLAEILIWNWDCIKSIEQFGEKQHLNSIEIGTVCSTNPTFLR